MLDSAKCQFYLSIKKHFFSVLIKIKEFKVLWNQQSNMTHNPCLQGLDNLVTEVKTKTHREAG